MFSMSLSIKEIANKKYHFIIKKLTLIVFTISLAAYRATAVKPFSGEVSKTTPSVTFTVRTTDTAISLLTPESRVNSAGLSHVNHQNMKINDH
jgi:hypothetical protein